MNTPQTETMLRETRGQSFENQFRDAASLCEQLELKLTELAAAAKDVQDSIIAAANHEGREQNWLLKLRRMSEAIAAAMPNVES